MNVLGFLNPVPTLPKPSRSLPATQELRVRRLALLSASLLLVACGQEPTAPTLSDDVPIGQNIIPVITHGEPDGVAHPIVGLMVAYDADDNILGGCTGTLMSPTVFLTAGHCTYGVDHVRIWFESDVEDGLPDNGFPIGGGTSVDGTPYPHPGYDPNAFLNDLGVAILDEEVVRDAYGELPQEGALDAIPASERKGAMTVVGYGRQSSSSNPAFLVRRYSRFVATVNIVNLNGTIGLPFGTAVMVSANAHTGGVCFGDSGGPFFLTGTNVVAAVTSFVLNYSCAGAAGGYRVDQADDLAWVSSFLHQP